MLETKERQGQAAVMDQEQVKNDHIAKEFPNESRNVPSEADLAPLFKDQEAEQFRAHWLKIQNYFIDNPNASVRAADELVAIVIENITTTFATKRTALENQWKRRDKVSTEELRIVLKRYRSFFNRLLSLED